MAEIAKRPLKTLMIGIKLMINLNIPNKIVKIKVGTDITSPSMMNAISRLIASSILFLLSKTESSKYFIQQLGLVLIVQNCLQ